MLKKLVKHEFKNTSKIMLAIYALVAVVTLLGTISFAFMEKYENSDFAGYLGASILVLYVLSIFALFIVTYVYMCVHFYKTMYSDQGYLTHTLPVSPLANLHVKIGVSFCWLVCSCLVMLLSLLLLLIGATQGEFFSIFTAENIALLNAEFAELDMTLGGIITLMIVSTLLSCVSYLLMVFASISIGQLFNQNKIGFSIIAGIAIYFVQQIAGTLLVSIVMVSSSSSLLDTGVYVETDVPAMLWNQTIVSSLILSLIFCVALYVTCNIIVRKHINLN